MWTYLVAGLLVLGPATVRSDEAQLASGIRALLEVGWQKTVRARTDANEAYQNLKSQAPRDARVPYGYVLVLLRQNRHAEAATAVEAVLAADPKHLSAWQLKTWLAALTKEYDAALADIPRVAELLGGEGSSAGAAARQEAAVFLGRLFGFFEGPAKESVDAAAVARARQRTAERLSPEQRTAFDAARREIISQFASAAEEVDTSAAAAEAEAAKQKELTIEALKRKSEELANLVAQEESHHEKYRQDLNRKLEQINAHERSLLPAYHRAEADAAGLRRRIVVIDGHIARLNDLIQREKDAQQKQRWLNELAYWRVERLNQVNALVLIDQQLARLNAERVALQQQRAAAQADYQREIARVEPYRRALERTRLELARAEGKPVSGNSPLVREQKRRAVALTSYVPLPISLEEERERLLQSLP